MVFRSDEAEADVQARIEAIEQNEIDQIRELGTLLDSELNYAEQYAQILRDVKDSWPGKCVLLERLTLLLYSILNDGLADNKLQS
jgi:hypothetical protein